MSKNENESTRKISPSAAAQSGGEGKPSSNKTQKRVGGRGRNPGKTAKPAADKQPKPAPAAKPAEAAKPQQKQGSRSRSQKSGGRSSSKSTGEKLKIISLGGLDEIGKNITAYEYGNDILLVDCGMAFPDDEMLGIDLVIPDFSYLIKNKDKVRGIVVTHGHEDHIGSIPYFLKEMNVPVYGSRISMGLLKKKLEEHGLDKSAKLRPVRPKDTFKLGCFGIECIRVNHSIADSMAFAISTPAGLIVHTGDFKIDPTPVMGDPIDLARFGELGNQGVLALLMDSTNAERPGYSMSERSVGQTFDNLFRGCEQRILVATFASNVDRVQQIINAAVKYGRKVAVSGRSMINMVEVATELGYLQIPDGTLISIDEIKRYPKNRLVIITTGSQGEPMSALYRMAYSDHRQVEIVPGDLVILSATPVPGNERLVTRVINELCKKGAEVVNNASSPVHVSGHAYQEELKIMMALCKPKFFIPIHGEFHHLNRSAKLAQSIGIPSSHIVLSEIGKVIELTAETCKVHGQVPSGQVFVDGLGVGDVGNIVLRDRLHLAEDGLIVCVMTIDGESGGIMAGPDIVSRGFVYVREAEDLMENMRKAAKDALIKCEDQNCKDWSTIKNKVKGAISDLIFHKTKRKPMILPIIMEV